MSQNTEHSEHIVPVKLYVAIFVALIIMTVVTTKVAFVDLNVTIGGHPETINSHTEKIGGHMINFNPVVALAIAIFKATLVILFFMHVKYSSRLTKVVVGVGVFFLLILLSLTMTDYLSRALLTSPGAQ